MVTFSPADVIRPKPDADTLLTVPADPPAAGPDRALEFPPVAPERVVCAAVVEELVAAVALDEPPQAESPIAGTRSPAVAAMDLMSLGLKSLVGMVMSGLFRFIISRWLIAWAQADRAGRTVVRSSVLWRPVPTLRANADELWSFVA
jgi:hypothetical protein